MADHDPTDCGYRDGIRVLPDGSLCTHSHVAVDAVDNAMARRVVAALTDLGYESSIGLRTKLEVVVESPIRGSAFQQAVEQAAAALDDIDDPDEAAALHEALELLAFVAVDMLEDRPGF